MNCDQTFVKNETVCVDSRSEERSSHETGRASRPAFRHSVEVDQRRPRAA